MMFLHVFAVKTSSGCITPLATGLGLGAPTNFGWIPDDEIRDEQSRTDNGRPLVRMLSCHPKFSRARAQGRNLTRG
jgi:hypothetical protein